MKIKPKGRKIYRYKTRFERLKGFLRNTGAVMMTVAGVGVLVFVGYSVGSPIMHFLEEKGILTAPTVSTADSSENDVVSASAGNIEQTTEVPVQKNEQLRGYYLEAAALSTQQSLEKAVAEIPEGFTHVIVPLKTKGGRLYYGTALTDVSISGAVIAAMPLETIYSTIVAGGYKPVAAINALEDNIYPQTYTESAYKIAGTSELWLDADGKSWLSPFSALTEDYLCNVSREIAEAGFAAILCEGLVFPELSKDDLAQLDPQAGTAERGDALADIVNAMQEAAGNTAFYISVDGQALLQGKAEMLSSGSTILTDGIVVSGNAETMDQKNEIQQQLQGYSCILQLEGEGSIQAISINGSYVVRP